MYDAHHWQEIEKRIEAAISRATACHMSNSKWRKLFAALRELGVEKLRWKFIWDEREFLARVPSDSQVFEDRFGDVLPDPYGEFREIDWIEIPTDQMNELEDKLMQFGQFPVQRGTLALRIVGYTW